MFRGSNPAAPHHTPSICAASPSGRAAIAVSARVTRSAKLPLYGAPGPPPMRYPSRRSSRLQTANAATETLCAVRAPLLRYAQRPNVPPESARIHAAPCAATRDPPNPDDPPQRLDTGPPARPCYGSARAPNKRFTRCARRCTGPSSAPLRPNPAGTARKSASNLYRPKPALERSRNFREIRRAVAPPWPSTWWKRATRKHAPKSAPDLPLDSGSTTPPEQN